MGRKKRKKTSANKRKKEKQLPTPYLLSTLIVPSIKLTNCLQIANPNPLPARFATLESEILVNNVNNFAMSEGKMPTPVSSTSKKILVFCVVPLFVVVAGAVAS
jgi:hypothetical protein